MPDPQPIIGLIVGSGMADFAVTVVSATCPTRCGMPSAAVRETEISGHRVLVLPRHGDRHSIPPHRINYRANLLALQAAGAGALVCSNTVGCIPARPAPGELAIPSQVIDYTWGREHSFEDGEGTGVQHVDFTFPFDEGLRAALRKAAGMAGIACRDGGVYGATQGPRLETAAEVDRLERDGVDYVGMTGMPEFGLAAELGLPVACVSMIVNRAAGRASGPIHADIDASIAKSKANLISLLESLFKNLPL